MKKKETEFLAEEEAEAILRVPDRRTLQGKRDYAILLTLLTTGLRKAELCGLKIGDLKTYRNQGVIGRIISDLDPFKGQISAVANAAAIGAGQVSTAHDVAVGDD